MRILWKISLTILTGMLLLGGLAYALSSLSIQRDFAEMERQQATERNSRVRRLLSMEEDHLGIMTRDWAQWDDTYDFAQTKAPQYLDSNLNDGIMTTNRLSVLYFVDKAGIPIWRQRFDLSRDVSLPLPTVAEDSLLTRFSNQMTSASVGLVSLDGQLYVMATHPILKSNGTGPAQGILIMGRLVEGPLMTRLNHLTPGDISILYPGRDISPNHMKQLLARAVTHNDTVHIDTHHAYTTYHVLRDSAHAPLALLKISAFPYLHHKARKAGAMVLLQIAILTILIITGITLSVHFLVTRPLDTLARAVAGATGTDKDFTNPLPERRDEIGILARAFARMLQRKDASQQQRKMESLLLLAGGVAHDLNNILGPSVALPELIIDDLREISTKNNIDVDTIETDLDLIATSNKRAVEVIKDLSLLSSLGNCPKDPIRPNIIIREVLKTQQVEQSLRMRTDISVHLSLEAQDGISGSDGSFSRLILNLVVNGIDAIADKGIIDISTRDLHLEEAPFPIVEFTPGHYVELVVKDTGRGIAQADLSRVFEPFFTKKLGVARKGSGLGLAIAKGVVQDFGGHIHVDSEIGRGTAFTVLFPALQNSRTSTHDIRSSIPSNPGEIRVLVVDDEAGQRRLARRILEDAGYVVITAHSGRDALSLYEKGSRFHLVVLDMVMEASFDGLDTYRAILTHAPQSRILIASGYAPSARGKEAIALGAKWLIKPYDRLALLNTIADMLGLSEPQNP